MIEFLKKVVDLLVIRFILKVPFKNMLRSGGSISSIKILYATRKLCNDIDIIFDIGANQGQFCLASNYFFPEAEIYSFEPSPSTFAILTKNTTSYSQINRYNFAVGDSNGSLTFYENNYSHASSALPISDLQKNEVPKTAFVKEIIVTVRTLDSLAILKNNKTKTILLKMDVQGFEMNVLKGAINSLKYIDYILFETSFVELYKSEPLFNEMDKFLIEHGFKILQPLAFLTTTDLQILQMDVIYKNIYK